MSSPKMTRFQNSNLKFLNCVSIWELRQVIRALALKMTGPGANVLMIFLMLIFSTDTSIVSKTSRSVHCWRESGLIFVTSFAWFEKCSTGWDKQTENPQAGDSGRLTVELQLIYERLKFCNMCVTKSSCIIIHFWKAEVEIKNAWLAYF